MKKPDEVMLLKAIQEKAEHEYVRDVINRLDIPPKRAWYILKKWSNCGVYEYGVNLDLGWLL